MAFGGEVAKAALEKATEAYTTIIEEQTAIEYVTKDVNEFKSQVINQVHNLQSGQAHVVGDLWCCAPSDRV